MYILNAYRDDYGTISELKINGKYYNNRSPFKINVSDMEKMEFLKYEYGENTKIINYVFTIKENNLIEPIDMYVGTLIKTVNSLQDERYKDVYIEYAYDNAVFEQINDYKLEHDNLKYGINTIKVINDKFTQTYNMLYQNEVAVQFEQDSKLFDIIISNSASSIKEYNIDLKQIVFKSDVVKYGLSLGLIPYDCIEEFSVLKEIPIHNIQIDMNRDYEDENYVLKKITDEQIEVLNNIKDLKYISIQSDDLDVIDSISNADDRIDCFIDKEKIKEGIEVGGMCREDYMKLFVEKDTSLYNKIYNTFPNEFLTDTGEVNTGRELIFAKLTRIKYKMKINLLDSFQIEYCELEKFGELYSLPVKKLIINLNENDEVIISEDNINSIDNVESIVEVEFVDYNLNRKKEEILTEEVLNKFRDIEVKVDYRKAE